MHPPCRLRLREEQEKRRCRDASADAEEDPPVANEVGDDADDDADAAPDHDLGAADVPHVARGEGLDDEGGVAAGFKV